MEDKQLICIHLTQTLRLTRGASDLLTLQYDPERDVVTAVFQYGTRVINVCGDSGTAMIRDIVNNLGC